MEGISVVQVLSDKTHYGPLVCRLCERLVPLAAAVVSSPCAHPFCQSCLVDWAALTQQQEDAQSDRDSPCPYPCPTCHTDLIADPSLEEGACLELSDRLRLAVRPLADAQPLAHQLLQLVQVACLATDRADRCDWSGNYGDFGAHVRHSHAHQQPPPASQTTLASPLPVRAATPLLPIHGVSPLVDYGDCSVAEESTVPDDDPSLTAPPPPPHHESPTPISLDHLMNPKSPRWNSSDKGGNGITNGSIAQPPQNGKAALTAAPTSNGSMQGDPYTQPTIVGRDTPPNLVKRTKSMQATNGVVAAMETTALPGSAPGATRKPVPEDKALKRRQSSRKFSLNDSINDLDNSQNAKMEQDNNQNSINSLQGWNNSFSEDHKPLETLTEVQGESSVDEKFADAAMVRATLEQAEKLKKQANAKFNKGDFIAARTLYNNGINLMASVPQRGEQEAELLSNMHSNRAVTYFREKMFDRCIDDCNMAIQYDKTYEKSWIRKWRALMALGVFDEALASLELGGETVTNPSKIRKELSKARQEMDLLQKTRRLLEDEDFGSVRDMLKSYVRSSDNIGLLHAAALADCGLGNAEAGLEKANKALRFNPNQADGLAIRGLALFLSGETEKGATLMQDAYGRDKENKRIKKDHMRCSKTLSLVTKGRSCVKRGRYMDAVEHFTSAIKESSKISEKTVLYGMLRTERAEAWMLSDKYLEALKDCQEVINAQRENAAAWTVRAEVLIALGKAEEAKKELAAIRKSWGAENQTIEEGYRRVDFEMRVLKEDRDLMRFIKDLDRGLGGDTVEPLQDTRRSETRGERTSSRNGDPNDRRAMMKQTSSRRLLNGDHRQISSRRLHENGDRQKSARRLLENGDRQPSSRRLENGDRQPSSRRLENGDRQPSSRRLENGDRQPSSRRFLENGDRQPSSRRLTESGHRQSSSRRFVNSSSGDDDRRLAMIKAKSSRRMADGENSSNNLNGSRQKKRPNGLDRKSMSERNFDTSKQRPSSVKRT